MNMTHPEAQLDERFSSPGAEPADWKDALAVLSSAGVCWLSTVRKDGRPHVTPVAGIWFENAFYFSTGPGEQKALNLARNPKCVITVGQSDFWSGLDVVVEGEVERISNQSLLRTLAFEFSRKYDDFFGFIADDGYFRNTAGALALVYRLNESRAFGFTRGNCFSQTRWTITERR